MGVWGRGMEISRTPSLQDRVDTARVAVRAHARAARGSGLAGWAGTAEADPNVELDAAAGGGLVDVPAAVADLLTDLMHLSFDAQADFTVLVRTAQRRFCHEHLLAQMGPTPRSARPLQR